MDFYVNKLFSLGIPACSAAYIVADFVKTYHGVAELEEYIEDLERDMNGAWEGVECVY